jgi:hypothetical protein
VVQIQEADRTDLTVRLIAAAARDHGPAVFVLGTSLADRVLADLVVRHRIPVDLVAVGAEADAVRTCLIRVYDHGVDRVRTAYTLADALFGKQARLTSGRGAGVPPYEYDADHGMLRFNPLAGWSDDELRAFAAAEHIEPYEPVGHPHACRPDAERVAA